jgi:uncharacterized protein YndB with AHSA1/START domain
MRNMLNVTTSGDREIVITRVFNAPRHLVWNAVTKPELLKRWLIGPPGWEIDQFEDDVRAGGKFRWSWRGPEGAAMAMSGVYKEVVPPERVVRTESFEFGCAPQAGEQIASMVLLEKQGVTTLTLTVLYPSKEARDGAVASGMERGLSIGYDRIDEILAEQSK